MAYTPKLEIPALIKHLETFRVDQEQKLELAQALMLGAAMGLKQQEDKICAMQRRINDLQRIKDEMAEAFAKRKKQ